MLRAAAAVGFDEMVEVVFSVVVGEFFAGLDGAFGEDEDFLALYLYFAVWTAGMVDIASDVLSRSTVDGFSVANFEKVFSANAVRFVFVDDISPVLNDKTTFWDCDVGENAQASSAFARLNVECCFSGSVRHRRK